MCTGIVPILLPCSAVCPEVASMWRTTFSVPEESPCVSPCGAISYVPEEPPCVCHSVAQFIVCPGGAAVCVCVTGSCLPVSSTECSVGISILHRKDVIVREPY